MTRTLTIRLFTFTVLVMCWTATIRAQNVRIVSPPERLPLPFASVAKISPTGEYISFSGERFNKLFISNTEGSSYSELCSHAAAGWGHTWSPDGQFIALRANHHEEKTKRVAVEMIDVANKIALPVTDWLSSRARLSLPEWSATNVFSYSTSSGIQVRRAEIDDSTVTIATVEPGQISLRLWSVDALEVRDGMKLQAVRPFRQSRQVLSSAWSPERNISAVEFSGRPSLYVVSEDGKTPHLVDAKGEYPCWINDRYVVYMVTEDDGYKILSGDIWIADKDGKMKKKLTEGLNEIALYPSASKDGTIVFTTESGSVYKMKVAVE
ncbi:MAG TPA: hypothetical protein VGB10_04125 [Bacteroidota bacterium]